MLVKLGVPYDVAMRMSNARRLAWLVTAKQAEGGKFNWTSMSWEPPPT